MKTTQEIEALLLKWKEEKKPSKIAASFTKIEELQDFHIKHFKDSEYLWKPMGGTVFGGVWLEDNIDYVHLILATQEVMEHIFTLRRQE